ncbi:TenA family transcriptional regulator [Leptolyngbyaceae cyanobacterium CCMR0082]|uniref:Aminopyrimidine aminohydrolase n=2 Tax=Adonisia turfae TaxID=2950184 RepID=A0A6M0S6G5_9CYAN|nr:TenA family transcriptional regulator [Adonisia turfae]MDV3350585.1 TenA family transcriptional regulator [Leptothoe sp. LEGE 181152]NEZ54290.1 TenA family transcriptional regulator [Adonisia turfae CCMR0081]NEZ63432.1 TenA family transcriptional regulator [Adonisia turfae CCMR0082]
MPLTCQQLLTQYPNQWQAATVHPFLTQCQQGSIQAAQFNTWLVQDYHFVIEFTRFAANLIQAAPTAHLDILLGGIIALKDELTWFQAKATERQLNLNQALQPTCKTYCQFMAGLTQQPYPVKATAFWAIELAYNQGWQGHSPMPAPYAEFADRWGNAAFTTYVELLAQQADSALQDTDETTQAQAETAFLTIARLEKDFWQMAYEGS